MIFTDYCKRCISDIDSKCCAQIKRSHIRDQSRLLYRFTIKLTRKWQFFSSACCSPGETSSSSCSCLLPNRILRVIFISSWCCYNKQQLISWTPGRCLRLNTFQMVFILRELCLLLFLVKLYWTESTPLLTNYFSSAVSIVEDRYLYFAVWRRKDRITSKFPGNLVTNVTTRNKRDNFISDQ